MIYTQTSLGGYFRIELYCEQIGQNAPHVYKRSHNYIHVTDLNSASGSAIVRIGGFQFVCGNDKRVTIDTSDLIRSLHYGNEALILRYTKGALTDTLTLSLNVNEGADPHELAALLPMDDYLCELEDYKRLGYHLPNVILSADSFGADTLWHCDIDGSIGGMTGDNSGQFILPTGTTMVGGADYPSYISVKETRGTTALVEWDALVGYNAEQTFPMFSVIKRAAWEVVSQKTSVAVEEYTANGNGYHASKTPSISLTMKIGGLDAYSMHYYSDIIAANDVRLILDKGGDLTAEESRVEVQTKDVKTQMVGDCEYFDLIVDVAFKGLL